MTASFVIRLTKPDDLGDILSLNDLAFGQEDESGIVQTLEDDGDSLLSLVADADGRIVGHIQFFPIECLSTEQGQFAGLGPMSVAPDLQKSGIGSALIEAGLERLKQDGIQRVFVLGHKEYYPRFGFSVDETAGFASPWGGPYFMATVLGSGGPSFGELHYPAAFSGG